MKTLKGNNKLILCEAEMIQMAERYLNGELLGPNTKVKVSGIKFLSNIPYVNSFEIQLEEVTEKES